MSDNGHKRRAGSARMRFDPILVVMLMLLPTAGALEASYEEPTDTPAMERLFEGGFITDMIVEDDGSVIHTELHGQVERYDPATGENTLLFTADAVTGPEWGMTGLARDDEGVFYTMYTTGPEDVDPEDKNVSGELRVSRWVDGEETIIFNTAATRSHNGGRLLWHDGALFVTLGDHARGVDATALKMRAQDPASLEGTILRMLPDGSPAPGNPAETDDRFHPLVYSYGHRNPFGIDWDPRLDTLVISDPAQDENEEVNHVATGANLGWPVCVGPCDPPEAGLTDPIVHYPQPVTPVGLVVVGKDYYVGSFTLEQIRRVYETPDGWTDEIVTTSSDGVLGLAVSPDEKWIYVGTWNGLWRFPAVETADDGSSGGSEQNGAADDDDQPAEPGIPSAGLGVAAVGVALAIASRRRVA
jgi:hypothetical protein